MSDWQPPRRDPDDEVSLVRREEELVQAIKVVKQLQGRAARVGVTGNREYNPGWHTALDLPNLLTVSEAITRGDLAAANFLVAEKYVDAIRAVATAPNQKLASSPISTSPTTVLVLARK